ncbi:hypothetical protein RhiirA4_484079 [Rhizophagus irregularis]|uniref:Uncharacterized protein n=1 Tax=Rhizophagus irregularis TaxID=588596 RepID=A0A2I1HNF3_9GLOM|nr:hypothetical protein RhiirA4_484079 [Rhizophagus irregularis]
MADSSSDKFVAAICPTAEWDYRAFDVGKGRMRLQVFDVGKEGDYRIDKCGTFVKDRNYFRITESTVF